MTSELERDPLADFHRHRRRREYAEAEEELRAGAETGADEAAIELAWGRLEFARQDYPAALQRFVKAIEFDRTCDEAVGWRVAALSRLCYFEAAGDAPAPPRVGAGAVTGGGGERSCPRCSSASSSADSVSGRLRVRLHDGRRDLRPPTSGLLP